MFSKIIAFNCSLIKGRVERKVFVKHNSNNLSGNELKLSTGKAYKTSRGGGGQRTDLDYTLETHYALNTNHKLSANNRYKRK